MKKALSMKFAFCIMFLFILFFSNEALATNENITIIREEDNAYVIYFDPMLENEYEYTFTTSAYVENKDNLDYAKAVKEKSSGKYVMYISDEKIAESFSSSQVYLYARDLDGNYLAEGILINFDDCISFEVVNFVNEVTKKIPIDISKNNSNKKTENGILYTITSGRIDIIDDSDSEYLYYLVKLPNTDDYNKFMELAKKIGGLKANSELYGNIKICKEFYDLYNELMPSAVDWNIVLNKRIEQPLDSKNDEQYVLWIRNDSKEIVDVQFLTCFQDESKEFVKDKNVVKTVSKLPITYDSVFLFVVLGISAILLFIAVFIKKRIENKSDE